MTDPYTDRIVEAMARALIEADDGGDTEAILSATKHSGDCEGKAWTCALCQAVEYRHSARAALAAALEVMRTPDREMIDAWRMDQAQGRSLENSCAAMIDNLRQRT